MVERVRWRAWPVELTEGDVVLRPLRRRDASEWRSLRGSNHTWLAPWEATHPDADSPPPTYGEMVRRFGREARAGRMLPFAVEHGGRLAGQLTVNGITWGSLRSAHVGYWIDRAYWGMGIASRALHLLLREVAKRPLVAAAATSNGASLRVLQKCGFVVERVRLSPASDRFPECEEAILVLR